MLYLSFFVNCFVNLMFSHPDLKPATALVFYGQCRPVPVNRLPENIAGPAAVKKDGVSDFPLTASSGAVLSTKDNAFLFQKNAAARQPIASLSKLMTALVFLDNNPRTKKSKNRHKIPQNINSGDFLHLDCF
jgi:D-alanyl-D-alanine carboxypeptidase